ncbi:E3 ubiquitin/ISG15 ligase TRIM25-like isoform X2 [Hyperolius riggenbachi]
MASSVLREELDCSICLNIYRDPVTLRCGHNFCRDCIQCVLDTQGASGVYNCPECREEFHERPTLRKNKTLCNITEHFVSSQPDQIQSQILCTNCIHTSVPAVKTCLLCESSLCDDHLKVHSKAPEHILIEPTSSLVNRKCATHKKILEYYCSEDASYICISCRLDGEHKGHKISLMKDISDKKKDKLKNVQKKLTSEFEKIVREVQKLKECVKKVENKAANEMERVTAVFMDIRRHLEDLEKQVLTEVSRQKEQAAQSVSHLIKKLEIEQDELSTNIRHIQYLLEISDPYTILQESRMEGLMHKKNVDKVDKRQLEGAHGGNDIEESLISKALYSGLSDFLSVVKLKIPGSGTNGVVLDINTACEDIDISGDLKTISRSEVKQYHPQKFQYYPQVLSSASFCSGKHSWEVETSDIGNWRIGVSYSSIERSGDQSYFGDNKKSWCLRRYNNSQYSFIHDAKEVPLPHKVSGFRLKICLDYDAGHLSFYELCGHTKHLHTFTASFTEPLHAAFCVWDDWVKITT